MTRELASTDGARVQQLRLGLHRLIVDGPSGLETIIEFDDVTIEGRTIDFARERDQGRYVLETQTAQMEAGWEELGEVGEWLREFAEADDD